MMASSKRRERAKVRARKKSAAGSLHRARVIVYRVGRLDRQRRQALIYAMEYGFWTNLPVEQRRALSERPTAFWPREMVDQAELLVGRAFRQLLGWHGSQLWQQAGPELVDLSRSDEFRTYKRVVSSAAGQKPNWADLRRLQAWLAGLDRLVPDF